MWTRLVAGAAAHDINNLAQGFSNLLSLASAQTTPPETLERYADLARDGLDELRRLGGHLRILSSAGGPPETQRLDLVIADALMEIEVARDRGIDLGPTTTTAVVRGSSAALRLAIDAVIRYCVAASGPKSRVSVGLSVDGAMASVVVTAPAAPPPRSKVEAELGGLLAGEEREFGADVSLVLAGAVAHLSGGGISAGPAPGGGLRFKLSFMRAETSPRASDAA